MKRKEKAKLGVVAMHESSFKRKWLQAKSNELIPPLYLWLGLIILAVFTLTPFLYLFTSSISGKVALMSGQLIPSQPTWDNYVRLLTGSGAADYLKAMPVREFAVRIIGREFYAGQAVRFMCF